MNPEERVGAGSGSPDAELGLGGATSGVDPSGQIGQLQQLQVLLDAGTISRTEFDTLKAGVLSAPTASNTADGTSSGTAPPTREPVVADGLVHGDRPRRTLAIAAAAAAVALVGGAVVWFVSRDDAGSNRAAEIERIIFDTADDIGCRPDTSEPNTPAGSSDVYYLYMTSCGVMFSFSEQTNIITGTLFTQLEIPDGFNVLTDVMTDLGCINARDVEDLKQTVVGDGVTRFAESDSALWTSYTDGRIGLECEVDGLNVRLWPDQTDSTSAGSGAGSNAGEQDAVVTESQPSEAADTTDLAAQLERSAPADDIVFVAEQILAALVADDDAEFRRWATYSKPATDVVTFDRSTLRCEVSAGRCNVDINDAVPVVMGFDYSDSGWSGWSFSVDGDIPDTGSADSCDWFSPIGNCLAYTDDMEPCGELGVIVYAEGDGWCPEVTRIQAAISAYGSAIEIDGFYGLTTQQAVMNFQRFNGLESDGTVGPDTWKALSVFEPTQ